LPEEGRSTRAQVPVVASITNLPDLYRLAVDSWTEERESALLAPQQGARSDVGHVVIPPSQIGEQPVCKLSRVLDALIRRRRWHIQPHHVGTITGQPIRNNIESDFIGAGIGHDLSKVPATQHHHHDVRITGRGLGKIVINPRPE